MDGTGKGYTTMRIYLIHFTHLKMANMVNFMFLCFITIKNT